MNVKAVAKLTGLPPQTVRYYESVGLVTPGRADNGYRVYGEADIDRLRFVTRARALGFSLDTCRDLLALHDDQSRCSADVRRIAQDHVETIDGKIEELRAMRAALSSLVEACRGDGQPDCPIIESLAAPQTVPADDR